MYKTLESLEEFNTAVNKNAAALIYFSHDECGVCQVLKPKVEEMMVEKYPKVKLFYANTVKRPEIAAQQSVFSVPTLLVYFDGKESVRKSRNLGVDELNGELSRPYELMFS